MIFPKAKYAPLLTADNCKFLADIVVTPNDGAVLETRSSLLQLQSVNPSNVLKVISTKVGKHVPSLDMPQFIMSLLPPQYQLLQPSLVHAGCGFAILNSGCKS
jgi:hypothetical protein